MSSPEITYESLKKIMEDSIRTELLTPMSTLSATARAKRAPALTIGGGPDVILPQGMSIEDALSFLTTKQAEAQGLTSFNRLFKYKPWDGAHATDIVLKRRYGSYGGKVERDMFGGTIAPPVISVASGVDEFINVPWGNLQVGALANTTIALDSSGYFFTMNVTGPVNIGPEVDELFDDIEHELLTNSLYRGKAVDGAPTPNFIDLSLLNPERVVYSPSVMTQLEADLWSLMRFTDSMEEANIPLKRSVVLYGPYGTGKTLAALRSAQIAVENNWTCIMCRPGVDDVKAVIETARSYQPCLVICEDIDVISGNASSSASDMSEILDTLDGMDAKGTKVICVFTTNHLGKLHRGLMRPGRLDSLIHVGALDQAGIQTLAQRSIDDAHLHPHIDWELVANAMEGYVPAFVKEAIDRSQRYAMVRNGGKVDIITTTDLVNAAESLRFHHETMESSSEEVGKLTLDEGLREMVGQEFISWFRKFEAGEV